MKSKIESPLDYMFIYLISEWKIQFAVIYKGYKFFNREPVNGFYPEIVLKCPVFKVPHKNNLCLQNGMKAHWQYFKRLSVRSLR